MKVGDKIIKISGSYKNYLFEVTEVFYNGKSVKIKPLQDSWFAHDDTIAWWNIEYFRKLTPLEALL